MLAPSSLCCNRVKIGQVGFDEKNLMRKNLSEILDAWWSVPLGLLVVTVLAYGLLIPFLGYYFDDWPVIWMTKNGSDFWEFYTYDRPFSAWTYVLTAPLFGLRPLGWHVFTLLLRWLTSWASWWVWWSSTGKRSPHPVRLPLSETARCCAGCGPWWRTGL